MSLKDLLSQPVTIPVGKNFLTLNPLTLTDIIKLSKDYYPEMSKLMSGEGADAADLGSLLSKAPMFAATLIAFASGEEDEVATAAKLPFSVQLIAIQAIWEASMIDEASVGKFVLALSRSLTKLNALLKEEGQKQAESLTPLPKVGT